MFGIRPGRALPACALLSSLLAAAAPSPADAARKAKPKPSFADAVVEHVNAERRRVGVRPLRRSAPLASVAGGHAFELSRLGRLDHASADGTPMDARIRATVPARVVGETVAWLPPSAPPSVAVSAWMQSPSHRASLLSPRFARIGVARRPAPSGAFVAADLASAR